MHSENVYHRLLSDILRGTVLPGESLIESDLAKRYGVSRTPIREAVLMLQREGLVIRKSNSRSFVRKISMEELEEIFDIITILEAHAAEKAICKGIEEAEIALLRSQVREMEEHIRNHDTLPYLDLNSKFHLFFVQKCGNATLHSTIFNMRCRIHRVSTYMGLSLIKHSEEYLNDHKKLIEAVAGRKPTLARKIMMAHNEKSKRNCIASLSTLRIQDSI